MAPDPLARRDVLGGSLALAAAMTASVAPTSAAQVGDAAGILARIDEVAQRCRDARQAFDGAVAAFEAALPPPHPDIDMTNDTRGGFGSMMEVRLFDGARPKRIVNHLGYPDRRYVATTDTLLLDWRQCGPGDRRRRKAISRMMRRAERREAEVVAMEAAYRLEELEQACRAPDQKMEEFGKAVFARPAATMADTQAQARMLCAFEATSRAYNKAHLVNVWGMVLAKGLVQIGAAA